MVKRKSLSFDSQQLTKDLKKSAGQGVDVFFSNVSPALPTGQTANNMKHPVESAGQKPARSPSQKDDSPINGRQPPKEKEQASNIASKQASNIAILQFDDVDIDHLREAAYKAQTYRFADREVEWIKDTAHELSKDQRRGKVAQVDILRVAIKLFEKALVTGKKDLIKVFERMK